MKNAGFGTNVIAYSAAISALSKGQQWEKALRLFREIEGSGARPSGELFILFLANCGDALFSQKNWLSIWIDPTPLFIRSHPLHFLLNLSMHLQS